jgi:Tol biopolymer transport system component
VIDSDGVVSVWNLDTGLAMSAARLPAGSQHTLAPDGYSLAFFGDGKVMLADLRSGAVVDVTPAELAQRNMFTITGFQWSPDSASVLFDLEPSGADPPEPMIFRADMTTGAARAIVAGIGPTWSPDGQTIGYAAAPFEPVSPYGGGPGGILTLARPDGSAARLITDTTTIFPQYQPISWSRDGARIAAGDVVVSAADGAIALRVAPSERQVLGAIEWLAPDGRSAGVWRSVRRITPGQDDPGTFDEADEFLIVAEDGSERLLARSRWDTCPCMPLAPTLWVAWTPPGQQALVAGTLEDQDEPGLWLLDTGAGTTQLLASDLTIGELPLTPRWAPDVHYALVAGQGNGTGQVWAIPLDGSAPVRIGAGAPLGWSP